METKKYFKIDSRRSNLLKHKDLEEQYATE